MSGVDVSIGFKCPGCGSQVGVSIGAEKGPSGGPLCSNCGREMVAAKGSGSFEVNANVSCKKCGSRTGLHVGSEPLVNCPNCGAPL